MEQRLETIYTPAAIHSRRPLHELLSWSKNRSHITCSESKFAGPLAQGVSEPKQLNPYQSLAFPAT